MAAVILISGPQIEFLRPSIYQGSRVMGEGTFRHLWLFDLAWAVHRKRAFPFSLLNGLAIAAGLCLLTRVPNALGLYAAFGLVWLRIAHRASTKRQSLVLLLIPLTVIVAFVALTGLINFARWGNPLAFADFQPCAYQRPISRSAFQARAVPGSSALNRIGYGLAYYFAPFWALRDAAGNFLWSSFEGGFTNCCVELPPSSFFVSDTLLVGLCIFGIARTLRTKPERRDLIGAVGIGLFVPIFLMLTAFSMTFRYRMEFYPFIGLFAFLGFGALAAKPAARPPLAVSIGAVVSIVSAHMLWLLYMLSPFGPAAQVMGPLGIVDFYRSLFN